MQRWLARLSFSMLIFGLAIAYMTFQRRAAGTISQTASALLYALAAIFFALFLAGIRARHARPGDDLDS